MADLEILNDLLFLRINGGSDTAPLLLTAARWLADDTVYAIPCMLVAMWLLGGTARRNLALRTFFIVMVALATNQLIAVFFPHPRPFMIGLGHAWLPHIADSSFPSNHMTIFCAAGISLCLGGMSGMGAGLLAMSLAVAWARIFLGVHYPLDMAGAIIVTAIVASAFFPVWKRCGGRVTTDAQGLYRRLFAAPIQRNWLPR